MKYLVKMGSLICAIFIIATLHAHAQLTTVPQDIDYSAWISSLIYSNNFSTDPTEPSNDRSDDFAQLEVFLITSAACISSAQPISYRLHIRNTGTAPAQDLFVSAQSSSHSNILSSKRKANEQDNALTALIWHEPALIPNRSLMYAFTVQPTNDNAPFQSTAVVEYFADDATQKTTTSHIIEDECSS